jgi:hypothetical protein
VPIGVATTVVLAGYYNSSQEEELRKAQELEKARHQEALKNLEKESSRISIFQDGADFLSSIIKEKDEDSSGTTSDAQKEKEDDSSGSITSMAKSFASLVTGEISESEFSDMIYHAQNITQKGDMDETRSTIELINLFRTAQEEVKQHITGSLGFLDLKGFDPTSMFYYLENEDAVKNPSWKRRKHRFFKGVDVSVVNSLNDALHLAEIAYFNTAEDIRAQLVEKARDEWELIYCQVDSLPEKPSHYLAIKRGQSRWDPQLEVLMAVRGTNSVPDLLTDALLDDIDYRDGKAHAGIMRSGQFLVAKHRELLLSLLKKSKKKEIKLTLVGHSLGAGTFDFMWNIMLCMSRVYYLVWLIEIISLFQTGAAAIAGMEFQNDEKNCFDVKVVGFGCPAILSKNLSERTKPYITTVVADADMIPRMSAETIGNVLLNIMEFDWTEMVKRDIEDALQEMKKGVVGFLMQDDDSELSKETRIMPSFVDSAIEKYIKPNIREKSEKRLKTVLHPPGTCVHFYRDGVGISGSYVPCAFFNEIDVARTMVGDHLTSGYRKIFLEVVRSFLADDHFSFDEKQKPK